MIRRALIALSFAALGCTAAVSPTGGSSAGATGGSTGFFPTGGAFPSGGIGGATLPDLTALTDGGTTSINGVPVFVTYYDGGVKTTVMLGGTLEDPLFTIVWPDRNHVDVTGDQNQDGVLDYRYQGSFDGTNYAETELWDHNFDGIFEAERIRSVFLDGGSYWLTETLYALQGPDGGLLALDAGGSYVATGSESGPNVALQACPGSVVPQPVTSCETFPPGTPPFVPLGSYQNIHVIENGAPGACPAAVEGKALDGLLNDALASLIVHLDTPGAPGDHFNAEALAQLLLALGNIDPNNPYDIGCGLSCKGAVAVTRVYATWPLPGNDSVDVVGTDFNPGLLADGGLVAGCGTNAGQLQEAFGHEVLHFAGFDHAPCTGGKGTPPGKDMIYGCGRYANSCQSDVTGSGFTAAPLNTPQSFHDDCYVCADDVPAHKELCGLQTGSLTGESCGTNCNGSGDQCASCEAFDVLGCALSNPMVVIPNQSCCDNGNYCGLTECSGFEPGGPGYFQQCTSYTGFGCYQGVQN